MVWWRLLLVGVLFGCAADASAQTVPPPRGAAPAARDIAFRVQGGLVHSDGSGFLVGAGVAARPFGNPAVEISGDGNYFRYGNNAALQSAAAGFLNQSLQTQSADALSNEAGFYGSGNLVYNVSLTDQKFTPFFGGGIGIAHVSRNGRTNLQQGLVTAQTTSSTTARPQILGGVGFPMGRTKQIRAEVRVFFSAGARTTMVLGAIGF